MSGTFTLADARALDDLQVFLSRTARIEEGAARLIAGGRVLAVYTAVLYPVGLADETPTVLGLRTFALTEDASFDVVVPIAALRARLDHARELDAGMVGELRFTLPLEVHTVTWAAISPPRGGWRPVPGVDAQSLSEAAHAGIAEVAEAVPENTGEQLVRRVRSEVWGRPLEGADHIPAGAAFAALSLGFLGDDEVRVYETGPWTRLTTARGHVLVKRRGWTLAR